MVLGKGYCLLGFEFWKSVGVSMVLMIIVGTSCIRYSEDWAVRHCATCGTVPQNEAWSCVSHDFWRCQWAIMQVKTCLLFLNLPPCCILTQSIFPWLYQQWVFQDYNNGVNWGTAVICFVWNLPRVGHHSGKTTLSTATWLMVFEHQTAYLCECTFVAVAFVVVLQTMANIWSLHYVS